MPIIQLTDKSKLKNYSKAQNSQEAMIKSTRNWEENRN